MEPREKCVPHSNLLDTSPYRYEIMRCRPLHSSELWANRNNYLQDRWNKQEEHRKSGILIDQRNRWLDDSRDVFVKKTRKKEQKQTMEQTCHIGEALLKIRREKLKDVLAKDKFILENELRAMGKTFYHEDC